MAHRYEILKQLLDSFAAYEQSAQQPESMTFEGFVHFLNDPDGAQPAGQRQLGGANEQELQDKGAERENSIAILITHMYRYAKLYTKKALQNSPLQSTDDFSFLIILLTHDSLSKTELINLNIHEKTTGMEIIKRLIRLNLMRQFDDEVDKRSQRVAITEYGRGVIFSVIDQMAMVANIVSGNLTPLERTSLLQILTKLDHFHNDIFMHDKQLGLRDIVEQKM